MQSEVEKLVERLRNYRPPVADGYGYPVSEVPREHHVICDEAAALIERLYREREKLREALKPFAEAAGQVPNGHGPADEPVSDDEPVTMSVVGFLVGDVTAADLARARSALAEQPQ